MSKRIQKRKAIPLSVLVIILISVIGILTFMFKTDAPIVQGDLEYNLTYSKDKTLDIYYPTTRIYEKSPVLLYIHGGAWVGGRKEALNLNRFNEAFNTLRANGYTIISPEYTLAKENQSPFPACIQDGFTVIDWITTHADSLQLDITNFGIMGESAGAHIAMMNAFSSPSDFNLPYNKTPFRYLIDVYGPNDLEMLYHSQTVDSINTLIETLPASLQEYINLPQILFGFNPEEDIIRTLEFTNKFSPIRYVNKTSALPTLMIHGTGDRVVSFVQSIQLKYTLDELHTENQLHVLDNVDHIFLGATDEQKDSLQVWVSKFVLGNYENH